MGLSSLSTFHSLHQRDGLLDHFANAAAAESYFDSHNLTLDKL